MLNQIIKKVDPTREYNLSQIRDEGIFPWARNIRTIRKLVKQDYWGGNFLKARIGGENKYGVEYSIRGRDIIKFLKEYGPGLMMATSVSKKDGNKFKGGSGSGRGQG